MVGILLYEIASFSSFVCRFLGWEFGVDMKTEEFVVYSFDIVWLTSNDIKGVILIFSFHLGLFLDT